MTRTYSELSKIESFEERFEYLNLDGFVGEDTFGFDRYLNQKFYKSAEWKRIRNQVIIRDNGCDMGHPEHPISGSIIIHHMNPIKKEDIINTTSYLMNPEYLVCVSSRTHNAIHYGDVNQIKENFVERKPNDTCPWK